MACKFKSAKAEEDNVKEYLSKEWKKEPQFSVGSTANLPYTLRKIEKVDWETYEVDLFRGAGKVECRRLRYKVKRDSLCSLSSTLVSLSGCGDLIREDGARIVEPQKDKKQK